ncbi:hypothetical protein [Pararhodobacter oceanensis]|uniref:hypothetical protein n=1 Tax=Pararhodobacter oceanensis TaxID=2172121 RepID=UPI003A916350
MASPDYLRRLDALRQAQIEEYAEKNARNDGRILQIIGAVIGALAFFFFLKAVGFAQSGYAFAAPLPENAGVLAHVVYWFAGADPITQLLASAIAPAEAPAALARL